MKKYFGLLMVLGLLLGGSVVKAEEDFVACTMDAKQCPDGSFVGRQGPRCEFAPCPGVAEKREAVREGFAKKREVMKTEMEKRREEFMKEVQAKKEAFRNADSKAKTGFCQAARAMTEQRFESATTNLDKLYTRITNVVAKFEADGKDTSTAEASLDSASVKINEAKDKTEEIKTFIPESCEEVTPEIFEQVKILAREAKDLLQEARSYLREAVSALKVLREDSDSATETDQN